MQARRSISFMTLTTTIAVAFACILSAMAHAESPEVGYEDKHVESLTEATFDAFVQAHPLSIVEFYAPWCGHCKHLAPEYDAAAGVLKGKVPFAKIDATQAEATAQRFHVDGYPTLFVFREGIAQPYRGGRNRDEIVKYMKKQYEPSIVEVSDEAAFLTYVRENEIVAVINLSQTAAEFPIIQTVSESLRDDLPFLQISNPELLKSFGVPDETKFVLLKQFDDNVVPFQGNFEVKELSQFVQKNKVPLVAEFTQDRIRAYAEFRKPLAFLFIDSSPSTGINKEVIQNLADVAKVHTGDIYFMHIDAKKYPQYPTMIGLSGKVFPAIAIQRLDNTIFAFNEETELSFENLNEWVSGVLSGKVPPSIRSEPIPDDNSKPVLKVVGKTFEQLVLQESRAVFIKLYAPWCGHCKSMAPAWEKVGEKFTGSDKIVIAEMDGSINDISGPEPRIRGFPTIRFYPANDKTQFVTYDGARTFEEMVKFAEKNL